MLVRLDSQKLKQTRIDRNLTLEFVAEQGNTTERYLRDLESGRKFNPSAAILFGIAQSLSVPMETLITQDTQEEDR